MKNPVTTSLGIGVGILQVLSQSGVINQDVSHTVSFALASLGLICSSDGISLFKTALNQAVQQQTGQQ